MHFSLLFIIILLLIVGPEILHIAFAGVVRVVMAIGALYLFLGALFLLCFAGVEVFHLLVFCIGRPLATAIVDPILVFAVTVLPFGLWMDSLDDFDITRAVWRWLRRRFRFRVTTGMVAR
jgi:hypothetical protein